MTHKVPLIRAVEPEDVRSSTWRLSHLFKRCIAREEDQVLDEGARRAFFPQKVQQTVVAVREHDRAFGEVCVDGVRPCTSKGPPGFEGEESLAVCEDGHGGYSTAQMMSRTRMCVGVPNDGSQLAFRH